MSVLHRLPSGLTFVGKNDTAIKGAKTYRIEDAKGHIFSKSDDFILAPPSAKAKKIIIFIQRVVKMSQSCLFVLHFWSSLPNLVFLDACDLLSAERHFPLSR